MFFGVSGGPYGLESLVALVGGRNAFLLVLLTPLIWAVPVILMVLELNSMMPRNGGYYHWVKSGLGLFLSGLLSVSRLPKAMSDDGYLPSVLRRIDGKHGTPYISIIACAGIVSMMVLWRFEDLLIIDVVLYGSALLLEFIALIRLRNLAPGMIRPFRIPLPPSGLVALTCLPAFCLAAGIAALGARESIHTYALVFALGSLCTAPIAWRTAKRHASR